MQTNSTTEPRESSQTTSTSNNIIGKEDDPVKYAEIKGTRPDSRVWGSHDKGPHRNVENLEYADLDLDQSSSDKVDTVKIPQGYSDYEEVNHGQTQRGKVATDGKSAIPNSTNTTDNVGVQSQGTEVEAEYGVVQKAGPLLRNAKALLHTTTDGKQSLAADKKNGFEQILESPVIKADDIKGTFLPNGKNSLKLDLEALSTVHKAFGKKRAFEAFQADKKTARETIEKKKYGKDVKAAALAELTRLGVPEQTKAAEQQPKTIATKPPISPNKPTPKPNSVTQTANQVASGEQDIAGFIQEKVNDFIQGNLNLKGIQTWLKDQDLLALRYLQTNMEKLIDEPFSGKIKPMQKMQLMDALTNAINSSNKQPSAFEGRRNSGSGTVRS